MIVGSGHLERSWYGKGLILSLSRAPTEILNDFGISDSKEGLFKVLFQISESSCR